jgi:hypothetical protein
MTETWGTPPTGAEGATSPTKDTESVAHSEAVSKNRHPSGWPIIDAIRVVSE